MERYLDRYEMFAGVIAVILFLTPIFFTIQEFTTTSNSIQELDKTHVSILRQAENIDDDIQVFRNEFLGRLFWATLSDQNVEVKLPDPSLIRNAILKLRTMLNPYTDREMLESLGNLEERYRGYIKVNQTLLESFNSKDQEETEVILASLTGITKKFQNDIDKLVTIASDRLIEQVNDLNSHLERTLYFLFISLFIGVGIMGYLIHKVVVSNRNNLLEIRKRTSLQKKLEEQNLNLERIVERRTDQLKRQLETIDKYIISSKTDRKGIITYASQAFCDISGYSREELVGHPHSIIRHPDMPDETFKRMWQMIQSGKVWKGEVKNRRKDGSFYWVTSVISPDFDSDNNIIGYTAVRQNITEKVMTEEFNLKLMQKVEDKTRNLKAKNIYTRDVLDSQSSIIMVCDHRAVLDVNRRFYEIFPQYLSIRMINDSLKHIGELFEYDNDAISIFDSGENLINFYAATDARLQVRKGARSFDLSIRPMHTEENQYILIFNDITELEQIRKSQISDAKFTAIGKLSAGITHEINTPLTYIKGNLEMLKMDIDSIGDERLKSGMRELAEDIYDGVGRIASTVSNMAEVVRKDKGDIQSVNLHDSLITASNLPITAQNISHLFISMKHFLVLIMGLKMIAFVRKVKKCV